MRNFLEQTNQRPGMKGDQEKKNGPGQEPKKSEGKKTRGGKRRKRRGGTRKETGLGEGERPGFWGRGF